MKNGIWISFWAVCWRTGLAVQYSQVYIIWDYILNTTVFHVFAPCAVGVSLLPKTSTTANSNISMSEVTATPSQAPDSGLTLLAFGWFHTDIISWCTLFLVLKYFMSAITGVMSLILILIVVMVVLVIAINLRGWCRNTKQHEGGFSL